MDAILLRPRSTRPFDDNSNIYLHCIDLSSINTTEVTSFKCLNGIILVCHRNRIFAVFVVSFGQAKEKGSFSSEKSCIYSPRFKLLLYGMFFESFSTSLSVISVYFNEFALRKIV